jgi:hypothetical protein
MKKLFVIVCLLGVLSVNCTTTGAGKTESVNRGFNSEIHGELYVERNAGFSMYIPKGWEVKDMNQKYLMVIGPMDGNFSPNISFGDEQYTGTIPDFIGAVVAQIAQFYADLEIIENESFITNTDLEGRYITVLGRINDIQLRQKLYLLQNKSVTTIMAITGSTLAISGEKYDALFDECVKTFIWTK